VKASPIQAFREPFAPGQDLRRRCLRIRMPSSKQRLALFETLRQTILLTRRPIGFYLNLRRYRGFQCETAPVGNHWLTF
jgi:hypothetical protein